MTALAPPKLRLAEMTPQQRERRKSFLTASETSAFLGLSRYKRAADVVAEKVFDLVDAPATRAARLGQMLHPGLVAWEAEERGIAPVEFEVWCEAPNGVQAATLDAVDEPREASVEGKTSGLLNPHAESDEWGEADSDQVPREVFVQVVAQMIACPTLAVTYVPALRGSVGWVSYVIRRDGPDVRQLMEWVEQQVCERWRRYVLNRDPLPDSEPPPSSDVLRRFRRVPNKTVPVPVDLYDDAKAKRAMLREIQKASEDADCRLKAALGDAEAGECSSGPVTFLEQTRKGYTVAETTFRVLRFPK